MLTHRSQSGFTLIELLIVVAIIAILALIAVPNFLEAQVRAKIARSRSDQRSIHLGVQSLLVDKMVLPIDFWDDDKDYGNPNSILNIRLREILGTPYQSHDNRGGVAGVLVPLTTPIAYITSLPEDPFATDKIIANFYGNLIAQDKTRPYTYFYADDESAWPNDFDHGCTYMQWGNASGLALAVRQLPPDQDRFFTCGLGPVPTMQYQQIGVAYDPTNGTVSEGQIIRYSE